MVGSVHDPCEVVLGGVSRCSVLRSQELVSLSWWSRPVFSWWSPCGDGPCAEKKLRLGEEGRVKRRFFFFWDV